VDVTTGLDARVLAERLPVARRRLVRADVAGDDRRAEGNSDGRDRRVDQIAIRVREDRETPPALARLGERRPHVRKDGP
jgi:hypothetical protein